MAEESNNYAPRRGPYYKKAGEYSLDMRVVKPEVNPGEIIHLEVYITGYGEIHGPKFRFCPPPEFIMVNSKETKILHSLELPKGYDDTEDTKAALEAAKFGVKEDQMGSDGYISQLLGVSLGVDKWAKSTIFYDYPWGDDNEDYTPTIASEKKLPKDDPKNAHAPIEIHLKTKPKTPSGTHTFQCYLTYYNGRQWKTDHQSVNVVVPNWFKRHENVTWVAAITGVLLALLSLSLNVLNFFLHLGA